MARIVAQATSGLAPKMVLMTPVEATRKVLKKAGWTLQDVDLLELNEAFAVQAVAVTNELAIDPSKVNVNGGAVALGHPIGASGARVLTTLLYALRDRGGNAALPRCASVAAMEWPWQWNWSEVGVRSRKTNVDCFYQQLATCCDDGLSERPTRLTTGRRAPPAVHCTQ